MLTVETKLAELWDSYGKVQNERQMKLYARWARSCEHYILMRAIDQIIDTSYKFPTLAELKSTYNGMRPKRDSIVIDPENVCYWCQDTGAVPAIDTDPVHGDIVRMYGCKCSSAMSLSKFHLMHPNGQEKYMGRVKELKGFAYPQAIQIIFRELHTNERVDV
tara:strand:- start:5000 stop:5485 length:486 start_codon:yes stop_codon:yes gene_type:complete